MKNKDFQGVVVSYKVVHQSMWKKVRYYGVSY